MASREESASEKVSGRRTRSGRKVSATQPAASPARATRRTSRKQAQEQLSEHDEELQQEQEEDISAQKLHSEEESHQSDIIKEMLAEAAQGVVVVSDGDDEGDGEVIYDEQQIDSVEIIEEEVLQSDDYQCNMYEEQVIESEPQLEDVEMYVEQEDEQIITDVPIATETEAGIDEKSSSFPFGTVGQSETSEDAAEGNNETGAVESSLLASLGDNANSLPSVGGGEEIDGKKDFVAAKMDNPPIQSECEKMESDDSLSQPAIAEDLETGADGSDATIVNTEMVSEDELPLPTKPAINDAEEVSDDELPAPQRAELPADAEVISEDELPTTAAADKKSPSRSPKEDSPVPKEIMVIGQKRKANDDGEKRHSSSDKDKEKESAIKKNDEQYNPMSPTTESNDAPLPPVEKKAKVEDSENKEKKREKEKDKDKDKDKDKEREKEKERKKLPDLDKYWRAVKDDPADFTGWTYLLQYVDNESDAEAAREAYDAFLSHYPYCYGYWRKYADYEKRKGIKANCNAVFERGLEAIPLSVDLWIHYLSHVKSNNADNEEYLRSQFERAIDACGLEFRSDKLWDAFIKWENDGKRYQLVLKIYDRLLAIPTQGYSGHFDNFQDLINQHSIPSTISNDELKKIRTELRETSSSRSSSSRSKSRRSSSSKDKEHKEREHKDEEAGSKSPKTQKDASETVEENNANTVIEIERDERVDNKSQVDLSDPSTLADDEISAIKDKVISMRRKVHKITVAAVTARWTFEEGIKRPYFHVKPLERCQLKNWKDYLDFEIEKGDRTRILVLFERCLIACALYDEFWLKMIRYLETQLEQPGIATITTDVFRRACQIHHPDKPSLHLMWAAFEECQNNFDRAAEVLVNLEKKCPNLLQIAYRRINVERRRGDLNKCRELYEHYISTAKNKTIAGSLAIKFARFLNKICNDLDGGLGVLQQALEKDGANTRVALQMIDLALQRSQVDEDEVVQIMEKFMHRDNIDPEQKVLFAQRKVEFLEDFGSTAKGLQDAQRSLQLAMTKANEAKKKRDSSPSRKSSSGIKDSAAMSNLSAQSTYNNGSAAANANYNYNSANSAYYGQQNSGTYQQQQSYDGYYNHWQYGSGYSGYGQWSGYGNYY